MSSPRAAWTRPHFQKSNRKAVDFRVLWLEAPIAEPRFNLATHGFPSPLLGDLDLRLIEDAAWLRNWTEGPWGLGLDRTGIDVDRLKRCRFAFVLRAESEDPPTLEQTQVGTAVSKALADMGAVGTLDVIGNRWWSPDALKALAPDRPFRIEEHLMITGESNEREPGLGHLCHTRGMRKFARPELFLRGITPEDFNAATKLFNDIGERMALGKDYGGQSVVILRLADTSTLPPLTFLSHGDDSDDPNPSHGLGSRMFHASTLEVVDYDGGSQSASKGSERILAAIRALEAGS